MAPICLSIIYPRSSLTMIFFKLSIPLDRLYLPKYSLINKPIFPSALVSILLYLDTLFTFIVLLSFVYIVFTQNCWVAIVYVRFFSDQIDFLFKKDLKKGYPEAISIYIYINLFFFFFSFQALYHMIVHWVRSKQYKPWMVFRSEPSV